MTSPLTIGAIKRAYGAGETTPADLILGLASRFGDADQDAVWISTLTREELVSKCTALEALPDAKNLPLYGMPFSVKDNIDVAGLPTTAACPDFAHMPDKSARVVAMLEAAGAICIGKTNLDQFATGLVGVRSPYGTPKNPFNAAYIPGGSSSGAGVSVSTGMVAFAIGTDTGGSGRVPASYNGIYGLKPAPGAWSRLGLVYACRSFDTASVFAADLEDALLVDRLVRGADPADAYSIDVVPQEVPSPRVALAPPDAIDTFGDRDVAGMYREAFDCIHALAPAAEADLTLFQAINELMFFGPYLAERDVSVGAFIDTHPTSCHPVVGPMIQKSREFTAADAYRAQYKTAELRKATQMFWRDHDVLITPTVGALVTLEMCEKDPLGPNFRNGTYTNFASPLGLAAIAVPFGLSKDGVPWGLTLYALPERLSAAVNIAKQLAHSRAK